MRSFLIWNATDPSQSLRLKAGDVLRMSTGARDGVIAEELRTLADRYVSRAFELECIRHSTAANDNRAIGAIGTGRPAAGP